MDIVHCASNDFSFNGSSLHCWIIKSAFVTMQLLIDLFCPSCTSLVHEIILLANILLTMYLHCKSLTSNFEFWPYVLSSRSHIAIKVFSLKNCVFAEFNKIAWNVKVFLSFAAMKEQLQTNEVICIYVKHRTQVS
jgi:hypothetical protein